VGIKLHEAVRDDGSHYSWCFYCPGCKGLHQCDERWTFNGDKEKPTFRASILVYEVPPDQVDGGYKGRPRCHSYVKPWISRIGIRCETRTGEKERRC
jgi:hypothetical protein